MKESESWRDVDTWGFSASNTPLSQRATADASDSSNYTLPSNPLQPFPAVKSPSCVSWSEKSQRVTHVKYVEHLFL